MKFPHRLAGVTLLNTRPIPFDDICILRLSLGRSPVSEELCGKCRACVKALPVLLSVSLRPRRVVRFSLELDSKWTARESVPRIKRRPSYRIRNYYPTKIDFKPIDRRYKSRLVCVLFILALSRLVNSHLPIRVRERGGVSRRWKRR